MKYKKIVTCLCIGLILLSTGCSSQKSDSASPEATESTKAEMKQDMSTDSISVTFGESENSSEDLNTGTDDSSNNETQNQDQDHNAKRIITKRYDLETNRYETTIEYIKDRVKNLGGYIENMSLEGGRLDRDYSDRYASFKIRLPKNNDELMDNNLKGLIVVRNEGQEVEDITLNYYDTTARLRSKEIHRERLFAVLEKADKVEAIIELENAIAEINYNIDNITTQIKVWDNAVAYTTVYVDLYEVNRLAPVIQSPNLLQRMGRTLMNSLRVLKTFVEELILFCIAILPFAIIIAVILIPVIKIVKSRRKRKSNIQRDSEE